MAIDKQDNGVAIIDEYSLLDYITSIQKCVQEGYVISTENEHYPQGMSGWYRVGMVKKDSDGVNVTSVEQEDKVTPIKVVDAAELLPKPKTTTASRSRK